MKPLRILCVVNLPWDPRLGASRVWIELAEQWRAAGHTVDSYSLSDAFPAPTTSNAVFSLRQLLFPRRAARFIREHAGRYDIIDSHLGTVPFSKSKFNFHGLLVARSVGFFWLYEKFDRYARESWPDLSRGKFFGRIFYRMVKRGALRSAQAAIAAADLVNLPNEDELKSLREDLRSEKPAVVFPYGLTEARRAQLFSAASSSAERFAAKRISFIGMWSVRKGARDFGEIIRRLRAILPEITFRFLGTSTPDENVLRDLSLERNDDIEIVSTYDPAELPKLLSDCTLGIFPSYIEGFGIGVLEQLAAGIPVVAYDAPGPRAILDSMRHDLLAPLGDTTGFSDRVLKIMRGDLQNYVTLQNRAAQIATEFSWSKIAAATIDAYRHHLPKNPIVFVQPFGLRSPGGGARILRALVRENSDHFVCTSPSPPPPQKLAPEIHLPLRPSFGRLDRSRFAGRTEAVAPLFASRFTRALEKFCLGKKAGAIHAVAHGGLDFYHAFLVAKKLRIPFFLQLHDDFIYSAHHSGDQSDEIMREVWQGAAARFVIGRELGEEYCRRYGTAKYQVVTDGFDQIAQSPRARAKDRLRVYFMGLFHLEYEPNLEGFLRAASSVESNVSMTLRCGGLRRPLLTQYKALLDVQPFADEREIQRDLESADLLYLPLPFDPAHESFVRFSLSTKVVTYLSSGVPIFYHGPKQAAVCELLKQNQAAFFCHSLEVNEIAETLRVFVQDKAGANLVSDNALALARRQFSLPEIRAGFWSEISHVLDS